MGDQVGGGFAVIVYMSDGFPRWLGVRRARYGSAPPASRVAARSLGRARRPRRTWGVRDVPGLPVGQDRPTMRTRAGPNVGSCW